MTDTLIGYWRASLVAGLAVLGVVALLLAALLRTTNQILDGSAQIWQAGKLIANNTVHIPLLGSINHNISEASGAADMIVQATGRIQRAVGNLREKGELS